MVLNTGGILDMADVLTSAHTTPDSKIKAFNSLVEVSGLAKQKDQQATQVGSGPLVQIIMPANSPPVEARIVSEQ
jgi:hypothetical protein